MSEAAATLSLFSLPACSHITVNHLTFLTSAFEKCVTITSWINLRILDLSHELMVSWKPQSCTTASPHSLLVLIFRTHVPLAVSFSSSLAGKGATCFNALGCPVLSLQGGGKLKNLPSFSFEAVAVSPWLTQSMSEACRQTPLLSPYLWVRLHFRLVQFAKCF